MEHSIEGCLTHDEQRIKNLLKVAVGSDLVPTRLEKEKREVG
jgi:hypothetical protein